MAEHLLSTHKISVIIFLVIYLIKTILLFVNQDGLTRFTKAVKVPEMIVSFLFLVTGVWLLVEIGNIKMFQIIKIAAVLISIPLAIVGFKKRKKALALTAMVLIILAYGLAEMSRKQPYMMSSTGSGESVPEGASVGQSVYFGKGNCSNCHGEDGTKGLAGATDLSKSTLSKEETVLVITNGRNSMAPYKDILTSEEIEKVTEFVMTLRK